MRTSLPILDIALVAAIGCGTGTERPPPGADDDSVSGLAALCDDGSFGQVVQPIFDRYCEQCHRPGGALGDLDLQSWSAVVLEGGLSGPAVVLGDCEGSLLYQRVAGQSASPMPPIGYGQLIDEEIACICLWIEDGCPDD